MFYDSWLTFLSETFLFLAVCAGLNMHYLKFSAFGDAFNSICAVLFGFALLFFLVFVPIFYNKKRNYRLILDGDYEFLSRFGSFLSEFNFLRRGRLVFVYYTFSTFRKLWLAVIVVR